MYPNAETCTFQVLELLRNSGDDEQFPIVISFQTVKVHGMGVDVWKTGEYRDRSGVKEILPYRFWDRLKSLPQVRGIYLYGSRARGDHRERSDIDLAISYVDNDPYNWIPVSDVIEEADTLLEISATDIEKAQGEFKNNVMKDVIALYER